MSSGAPRLAPLPIDDVLPALVEAVRAQARRQAAVVLEAPPGAGKTTRVPPALLPLVGEGEQIWVVEPRRLAARLAAKRVASELGEPVGERVGFAVRFEDAVGPSTRVVFVTDGILQRRLEADPALRGVGAVVFDEFHERRLASDVALALCRRLQTSRRPDLIIAVMSATLQAAPIARFLGGCPIIRSEGRLYPVEVAYLPPPPSSGQARRKLDAEVAQALRQLCADGLEGDVLVFLPGAREIRAAQATCAAVAAAHGLDVVMLHGDLPPAEQDRAVARGPRHKIILSTNVAESSITVEGIVAVIDSGLARVAEHSPFTGLNHLAVRPVARASCIQRAGRAGRLRPGRCLRLYDAHDFDTRPASETPEAQRSDVTEALMTLAAADVGAPAAFAWLDAPPPAAFDAALTLLGRLGAVAGGQLRLTPLGREMLRFPAHPRLQAVMVEAEARGVGEEGAVVAALVADGPIERQTHAARPGGRGEANADIFFAQLRFAEAAEARFAPERLRGLDLDIAACLAVEETRRRLQRALRRRPQKADDAALAQALLLGFRDRVGRRRAGVNEVLLAGGAKAQLPGEAPASLEWLVALEADTRSQLGHSAAVTRLRLLVAVEPEWLLELTPDGISETARVEWNDRGARAEVVTILRYEGLTLDESRRPPRSEDERAEAARLLMQRAAAHLDDSTRTLARRVALVRAHRPDLGVPDVDALLPDVVAELAAAADASQPLARALEGAAALVWSRLSATQQREVERLAPTAVTLPSGRRMKIHYDEAQPAWGASRLQDFFGLDEGPRVAGAPVVLHLLAPNQRAVQVTTNLSGFWERLYPTVRRELCRRYPRHAWPENPRVAAPPTRKL